MLRIPAGRLICEVETRARGKYYARLPEDVTPEQVAHPAYFGDEQNLRVGDVIEVEPEDLAWLGELVVRAVNPEAREIVTRWRAPPAVFDGEAMDAGEFRVKFGGPQAKHCIWQGDTRIETGFPTREQAEVRMRKLMEKAAA